MSKEKAKTGSAASDKAATTSKANSKKATSQEQFDDLLHAKLEALNNAKIAYDAAKKEAIEFIEAHEDAVFTEREKVAFTDGRGVTRKNTTSLKAEDTMLFQDLQHIWDGGSPLAPYMKKEISKSAIPSLFKSAELIKDMQVDNAVAKECKKYALGYETKTSYSFE